jgi:outer membrane protein OmpA-like peptidoglycan-associated protein
METQRIITMKTKTILLCTVALSLGSYSAYAEGYTSNSGPRYTPRPEISQKNYTQENRMEDRQDRVSYAQYEQREPCQNYRREPRGHVDTCATEDEVMVLAATETRTTTTESRLLPITHSYTVLFDFDKSDVRSTEGATLDKVLREISKYDPKQVTVTGYADSSGQADYNQDLSRKREQAVSQALMARGISNQTLDREARGEYDQAVQTADGVRNQENRRVVIDFRG